MITLRTSTLGVMFGMLVLAMTLFPRDSSAGADQYLFFPGPGDGYVEVEDAAALEPQDAITIETWIYLNSEFSHHGGISCASVVGKNYTASYWLGFCNSRIRFYPAGNFSRDSAGSIPQGVWTHIAVTYDEATLKFYFNGVFDSEFPVADPLVDSDVPLHLGSSPDYPYPPQGALDEIRIWDVARSEGEIAGTMETTISEPTTNLVGAWNFDNGSEADVGGFGGTLVGDAIITSGDVPTPQPTGGPTEPPDSVTRLWADATCNDSIDPVDSLALLRFDAGLSVNQEAGCPGIGEIVEQVVIVSDGGAFPQSGSFELYWGDANCDQSVDPVDSLGVLRFDAGLSVNQAEGCPPVGSEIDLVTD